LFGGLALIGVGIVILSNRSKGFTQVKIEGTSTTSSTTVKKEEIEKVNNGPKRVVTRKVPLEEIKLPEGFPREVSFYFGSQTGTAEKFCTTLD
jgi:hypothetical protein